MTVVVDAGILIARALTDEPLHSHAKALLLHWGDTRQTRVAPQLFRSEVTAVLRKAVYQQRITHDRGRVLLAEILNYRISFIEDDALLQSAYELAERFNLPRAYDSQYLALAERLDCEFWSTDEKLVNTVQPYFSRIRWLGRFVS